MTETPEYEPKISDQRMDQLLSAFYRGEVPEKLEQLPSTWSQVSRPSPAVSVDATTPTEFATHAAGWRGIAVTAATMAACVTLMVLSSTDRKDVLPNSGTTITDRVDESESEQMNVSGNGNASQAATVDEQGTTLPEIDQIDLSPSSQKVSTQDNTATPEKSP